MTYMGSGYLYDKEAMKIYIIWMYCHGENSTAFLWEVHFMGLEELCSSLLICRHVQCRGMGSKTYHGGGLYM